ncbi:MAG: endospore germination permease [Firmicutes bacterium]|nr:endospore germination permease [Bacillota bacterium]
MHKEMISDKQKIASIILFLVGSTSIFAPGLEAKKDAWLAFFLAIIIVLPLVNIFARLHHIFPDKDLFDMFEICFGKFIGKGIIIVFIWYTFFWAADVLVNYGQFIRLVSLRNTSQIIPIIVLCILCAWGIREGIEVLGRWGEFFFTIPIISIFALIALSIPNMNINNLLPVFYEGITPVLRGTFTAFETPLAQIVAFMAVFPSFHTRKSPYKVYTIGLLTGGLYMFLITLINLLVVGADFAAGSYYPSYDTASRIDVANIIQRIEVVISITFVIGGFIKISILLLCTCKGLTRLFGLKDYRSSVMPISLLAINLSYFLYDSKMHHMEFNDEIWPYYFLPLQVFLPIILLIIGEIKKKRLSN